MHLLTYSTIFVILFVLATYVAPLKFSLRSKLLLGAAIALAPIKSYLYYIVGGTPYDPAIPYNLAFVFDLTRSTLFFLALLVALRLVLNLLFKISRFDKTAFLIPNTSPFYAQLMLYIALALACFGTASAYSKPEFKPYEITIDRLDPRLDGLKVVFMSDIHISSPTNVHMIYELVKQVNELNPDLILLGGDLVDGSVEQRRPISDLLFNLKAKYGVYVVSGNHEYYSGYSQWRDYFSRGGLIHLDNQVVSLSDGADKVLLNLAGISDPKAALYDLPMPDIQGVISALDETAPSIVLSHRPAYAHDFAESPKKIDLVLSGHTHGGLVLGFDRLVARSNGGFSSGLYQVKDTKLIVCNGTMIWMGFPLRLGVPSQIDVITLRSKQKAAPDDYMLTRAADLERIAAYQKAKEQSQQAQNAGAIVLSATAKKPEQQKSAPALALEAKKVANSATLKQVENSEEALAKESENPHEPAHSRVVSAYNTDGLLPKFGSNSEVSPLNSMQLILPMVTPDGTVKESVTNVAILPRELTSDQVNRINAILEEDTPTRAQISAQEAIQEQNAHNTVTIKLIKNDHYTATKLEHRAKNSQASLPSAKVQIQDTKSAAKEQVKEPGKLQLSANNSSNEDSTKTQDNKQHTVTTQHDAPTLLVDSESSLHTNSADSTSNELQIGEIPDVEEGGESSREIEAIYGISLNENLKVADQNVSDLLTPAQENKEKSQSHKTEYKR